MQIVLDTATVSAALGVIAGVISTAGVSYAAVIRPLRRMLREIVAFREDWYGESARPGVPARKGVMERLADIDGQLRTNGGSSLRDAVSRIEATMAAHLQAHTAAGNQPAA